MEGNLTLNINRRLLHSALQYANRSGIDLSTLVEHLLRNYLSAAPDVDAVRPTSADLTRLAGSIPGADDATVLSDREAYLVEKYR